MRHLSKRLRWTHPQISATVSTDTDATLLRRQTPDGVLFVGLTEIDDDYLKVLDNHPPKIAIGFESCHRLEDISIIHGIRPMSSSLFQSWIPWSNERKLANRLRSLKDIWERHTSDDLLYVIQSIVHYFLTPLPEWTDNNSSLDVVGCIGRNCRREVIDCLLDSECRKALDCLNRCGPNDQVCSYRCIVSYESKPFESFSLCILQKHNCLGNFASIPRLPIVEPLTKFRGMPLTHETAEEILIGRLGDRSWSWKIAYGKNPAYDYFPCQFQLFYRGRGRGTLWYDPVFQVITLDGRRVWRRRHYRVRRASKPGSFHFSVLDNGVTSREFWRIVDADEDLQWVLFYYAGAASVAGINYTGAVLGTADGEPPEDDARAKAALRRCGIETWEVSTVDYGCCGDPPLEIPETCREGNL